MNTRIDQCFADLKAKEKKGFVAYICAGDPTLDDTVDIALRLEDAGVDILELGIPFSDPLADGPANQRAAERALDAGASLDGVFKTVSQIRERSQMPLVFFTYLNPLYALGFDQAAKRAAEVGVDGALIVDLAIEESDPYRAALDANHINPINLITPTTSEERIGMIAEKSSGFIYAVSRAGVTGEQSELQSEASELLDRAHRQTDLPIALGFGISSPEQARAYAEMTEAVVVGSYIVNTFHQETRDEASRRVKALVDAVKEVG